MRFKVTEQSNTRSDSGPEKAHIKVKENQKKNELSK